MGKDIKERINLQKKQVFEKKNHLELVEHCDLGSGILKISDSLKKEAILSCEENNVSPTFFIPASGSGSRMFEFLFDWMESGNESEELKSFFEQLERYPFFKSLPEELKYSKDKKSITECLLSESGLNFGNLPKGLIPFHTDNHKTFTAFQDHVREVKSFKVNGAAIEFSIQSEYQHLITKNIEELNISEIPVNYSSQSTEEDAICFKSSGDLYLEDSNYLMRPAGHGALLANLNAIKNDLVLIKNIDNIQHNSKSKKTDEMWKILTGTLLNFKKDLVELKSDFSIQRLTILNAKYEFLSEEELNETSLASICSRPTRVCAMVRNTGEPGGGPFWIKGDNGISKQIVEKNQIDESESQQNILASSSYFNPVLMAISKSDISGNKLDLTKFRDNSKYMVVKKPHKGEEVLYRELPGLWNGSMSNWNSIFIEVSSDVFSPVKKVQDLLKPEHQS